MNAPRKSLLKKRHARLAATQALYSTSIDSQVRGAASLTVMMLEQWRDSKSDNDDHLPHAAMPDATLLEAILDSAIVHHDTINTAIDGLLVTGWSRERTSAVLLALLQAASGEWLTGKVKARAMLVDEYTQVAASLLNDDEIGYVHKALNLLPDALAAS